jgi:hypothetical protein
MGVSAANGVTLDANGAAHIGKLTMMEYAMLYFRNAPMKLVLSFSFFSFFCLRNVFDCKWTFFLYF